jgi:hypothetical protein
MMCVIVVLFYLEVAQRKGFDGVRTGHIGHVIYQGSSAGQFHNNAPLIIRNGGIFPALRLFLTCTELRNITLDLFFALQNLSAARYLPSSESRGILRGNLLQFGSLAISDDFDVNSAVPLLEQVIKRTTDNDI